MKCDAESKTKPKIEEKKTKIFHFHLKTFFSYKYSDVLVYHGILFTDAPTNYSYQRHTVPPSTEHIVRLPLVYWINDDNSLLHVKFTNDDSHVICLNLFVPFSFFLSPSLFLAISLLFWLCAAMLGLWRSLSATAAGGPLQPHTTLPPRNFSPPLLPPRIMPFHVGCSAPRKLPLRILWVHVGWWTTTRSASSDFGSPRRMPGAYGVHGWC